MILDKTIAWNVLTYNRIYTWYPIDSSLTEDNYYKHFVYYDFCVYETVIT